MKWAGRQRKRVQTTLNKKLLSEYIDACELIEETERDIKRLNKKKQTVIQTNVSGSNPNFPYQPMHFKIQGTPLTYQDDARLRFEEAILGKRKEQAEQIRIQVQQFINGLSPRMQRIIRLKYFEGKSWKEVAEILGRDATADSVRMELNNFLKKEK